jgi:beta-1,4-N-acetylglucosaminyltransferase
MSIFVTVGTTRFDSLIEKVCANDFLSNLESKYKKIVIQYGNSPIPKLVKTGLEVVMFDFKPSLKPFIKEADVIISAGGAGTILEGLEAHKKMIIQSVQT